MSGDLTRYTNLITSQYADKPRFLSTVGATCQPFADLAAAYQQAANSFDVDVAVGQQLDVVGEWVGVTRYLQVPLGNVYFSWGTAGLGWGQGTWKGPYDPGTGQVTLADDAFRTLVKARIANNAWDGTREHAVVLLQQAFPGNYPFILDSGNLSMYVGVTGPAPLDAVTKQLLLGGYLNVRPAGVTVNYALPSPGCKQVGPGSYAVPQEQVCSLSRASVGSYVDGGVLKYAPINGQRWQDGALLVEGAGTSLFIGTERLWATSIWTVGTTLLNFYTVTPAYDFADASGSIGGVTKFVANASTSILFLRKVGLSLATLTYTTSIFIYVPTQAGVTSWQVDNDFSDSDAVNGIMRTTFDAWVRVDTSKLLTGSRTWIDFNINANSAQPLPGFTFYAFGADAKTTGLSSYIPSVETFVARASVGTYWDSTGTLQTAGVNVARMSYNPANLSAPPKLLSEAASTNEIAYPNPDPTHWSALSASITANAAVAPNGATTASRMTTSGSGGSIYTDVTVGGTTTQCDGIFVKFESVIVDVNVSLYWFIGGTTQNVTVRLNPQTGAFIGIGSTGATLLGKYIQQCANGWWRVSVSGTGTDAANTTCRMQIYSNAGTAGSLLVWHGQAEQSVYPSSPIGVDGAALTRAADVTTSVPGTRAADVAYLLFDASPPIFGLDVENAIISGLDVGSIAVIT